MIFRRPRSLGWPGQRVGGKTARVDSARLGDDDDDEPDDCEHDDDDHDDDGDDDADGDDDNSSRQVRRDLISPSAPR